MTKEYIFETEEEGIDNTTRGIVCTETVTEEREYKFTLEQKENALADAEQAVTSAQIRVDELTAEIAEIKTELGIE